MAVKIPQGPNGHGIADPRLPAALGSYEGVRGVWKNGQTAVSQTEITLWEPGTFYTPWDAAAACSVASNSGSDTTISVYIRGLDANFNEVSETIALNGSTPQSCSNQYRAVNDFWVVSNDHNVANVGKVSVGLTSSFVSGVPAAGDTLSQIPAGDGQANQCVFTVPANHTFFVTDVGFVANSGNTTRGVWWVHDPEGKFAAWRATSTGSNRTYQPFDPYGPVYEKSTIHLTGKLTTNTNTVTGSFAGYLVDNTVYS